MKSVKGLRRDRTEDYETLETEISARRTSSQTLSSSMSTFAKQHQSISSSAASLGSLLARAESRPHTQIILDGRLKIRATIDCGSEALHCKWSPDGSLLGVCLRSGEIQFYAPNGQLSHILPPPSRKADHPEFDFENTKLRSANDSSKQQLIQSFNDYLSSKYINHPPATSFVWNSEANNLVTATYSDGQIITWETPEKDAINKIPIRSEKCAGIDTKCLNSPGGAPSDTFITFTLRDVILRDMETFMPILTFKPSRPEGCILHDGGSYRAVSGRGKDVIGGGHSIVWWDIKTGDVKRKIGTDHIRGHSLSAHPEANRMVTGSFDINGDQCVKIWETSTGRVTQTLSSESYKTLVKCVTWIGKDIVAIGGSDPNLIRIVNLENITIGGVKGLRNGISYIDGFASRGSQASKVAALSSTFLYLIDLPK